MGFTNVIRLVAGDVNPPLNIQLFDEYEGATSDGTDTLKTPKNVAPSTLTVNARLRTQGATTILALIACTKVKPDLGWVRLTWGSDTLDITPGRYEVEITITDSSTGDQTAQDLIPIDLVQDFAEAVS